MNFWGKAILIAAILIIFNTLQDRGCINFDPHTNPLAYFLKGTFWIFVLAFLVGGRIVRWIKN